MNALKSASLVLRVLCVLSVLAVTPGSGQTNAPPPPGTQPGAPAPPPAGPPKRSSADLEKLAAPIALYPDPLIASILPASAYPLEIVQAARFVKDTNNIAKLDEQPWDSNVKAVARIPEVITQMDNNIAWTSDLGDAFINQSKELMDAIQTMRSKAQGSGALKTTPQQVVTVTNVVESKIIEEKTVMVTNQVVQIQPAQPDVVYVPQYNPTVVYAGAPVAYPGYYYPPYYPGAMAAASVVSFGAGMAMGAWLGNGCNWGYGDVDVDVNKNLKVNNQNINRNNINSGNRSSQNRSSQKWQPDSNRLKNSGSSMSSAQNRDSRGWSGQSGTGSRAGSGSPGAQARTTSAGAGASRGDVSRPSSSAGASRGDVSRPSASASGSRGDVSRPSSSGAGAGASRASSASAGRPSSSSGVSRSSPSSSSRSAFSSGGGGSTRAASSRGSASRGGGGGGRGGGGRR
jgi:hypothetical protein